eukprot:TRINITY_DN15821_c0_g1_i1.p1 TRINITY_DN15821_c0_g1~~TRINITY_DN15821_c0_g1_i1.p1  ORF type:complete len:285 (-),score=44.81 TRINITY_DN15821_c0_g1_i1:103-867(-)
MPGAVLWIHGLADTGAGGWSGAFDEVQRSRPGTPFNFPTAPQRFVTANDEKTTAWFDVVQFPVNENEPQDPSGIDDAVQTIHGLLDELVANGIKAKYIVLGGFSQGGAVSLLAGLSYPAKLGGIISMSGWCVRRDDVSSWISEEGRKTPVLMCIGDGDPVISYSVTKHSSELLAQALGSSIEIIEEKRATHMPPLEGREMTRALRFMTRHLPKTPPKKMVGQCIASDAVGAAPRRSRDDQGISLHDRASPEDAA